MSSGVAMSSTCPGSYCGRIMVNGSVEGDCGVCPRGERANLEKVCQRCTEYPELYDWLYSGFMAMSPSVSHWFFIEWYSGKKSSSASSQHVTAMSECSVSAVVTSSLTEPVGSLSIRSCRVQMSSDWYTMSYNPSPDYVNTLHCTQEAVYPLYTIVLIYYAFCSVMMMSLRPSSVKKIACGLGKTDRFRSIYAALYFFPIVTVSQAVGGGSSYYAFPYIISVSSSVTSAVYMSASEIQSLQSLIAKKKRSVVSFSHWSLHGYGIISICSSDKSESSSPSSASVPGPTLFYIATAKFTEPSRILSEANSSRH